MKRSLVVGSLLLLVAILPSSAYCITGEELLRAVDDLWRGESSYSEIEMQIVTERWDRTLRMTGWTLGTGNTLVVITYPPKEEGVATLMAGKDIWNYLPRVNRVVRVPSSMMSASWMGSHFTNDDLVKESRLSEDFDSTISFSGVRGGVSVYDIVLVPKPDAAVVWGRIEFTITQQGYLPLAATYYDEEGKLARTESFAEVKELSGRRMPTVMTLIPADKPMEKTVIRYKKLTLDVPLTPDFFSLTRLSRGGLAR